MNNLTKTSWSLEATYTGLPQIFYKKQNPKPVSQPKLIKLNAPLAASLGLDVRELDGQGGAAQLSGNVLPDGAQPIAQAYAGHQFGFFTMLGDGRAVLLGEQITPDGERFDIQLKGSGATPYSRGGDGRAATGPMLREYIISEAMHGLGIPTTRSLAVVSTGESVYREEELQGAVLTRVASSHIRVGTFEYAAHFGTPEDVKALADYTLLRHYPECGDTGNKYLSMLEKIVKRQAELIARWQLAGFVHGVMNTDNMSVCGETIDYGPCAFMDSYDPKTVFSSIDRYGRYAYGNQPEIAVWNLSRLAETLLPLIDRDGESAVNKAQDTVTSFWESFGSAWLSGMRAKLGLLSEQPEDGEIIDELLKIMHKYKADYTNTFLSLTFGDTRGLDFFASPEFAGWKSGWKTRLDGQSASRENMLRVMKGANPAVIPRNHRVEEALSAAESGDYGVMDRLLDVLSHPYAHTQEQREYASPPQSACGYKTFCGT